MKNSLLLSTLLLLASCVSEPLDRASDEVIGTTSEVRYCAEGARVEGIDVSRWQEDVDWEDVAASGKKFAIIRSTRGDDYVDPYFAANWAGAEENGLIRGAYHFFHPHKDALVQADLMVDTVGALGPRDLPMTIDVEEVPGVTLPSPAVMRAQIRIFVDRVMERTGVLPMIYTRQNFWDPLVGSDEYGEHLVWVADYSNACPNYPMGWSKWHIHQYSSTGSVPGVMGNCDLNYFDGTLEELEALANVSTTCDEPDSCVDSRTRSTCVGGVQRAMACPRGTQCVLSEGAATCEEAAAGADAGVGDEDAGVESDASVPSVDGGALARDGGTTTPGGGDGGGDGGGCSTSGEPDGGAFAILALMLVATWRRRAILDSNQ
jgi:lysozyme